MYYFASDQHLGLGAKGSGSQREKRFVEWLGAVSVDAKAVFLVGDVFDFWFEHKRVAPKGFTRVLSKIASMTEAGIEVHFFCGNHDMWVRDYFEKECGMIVHRSALETELYGKKLRIEHGHMVPRGGLMLALMTALFNSKTLKAIFSSVFHPNLLLWFGQSWSGSSRKAKSVRSVFRAEDEPLVKFARKRLASQHIDYFIFGHLHCFVDYELSPNSHLIVLGEWVEQSNYARLSPDGQMTLLNF